MLFIHILFLTWSACFGSIVFICHVVTAGISQLVLILSLIFGWTLSVQDDSLISFSRKFCNLFLDQFGFRDCFWHVLVLTWCLFWVNSFYLLCCFSRKFFSILSLIFGWTLSVQDVSLISFGRKFCNLFLDQFGFRDCFWHILVLTWCLFWVNSFHLLCCFSRKFLSIGIAINFGIWLNIIYSRCFIDIVW